MPIKVESVGIPARHASCELVSCDWTCDEYDANKMRKQIRKHIKETGHIVFLDKSVITRYEWKPNKAIKP